MDAVVSIDRPWLRDPLYGGMSAAAAEISWRAAQARREADEAWERQQPDDPRAPVPPVDSLEAFDNQAQAPDDLTYAVAGPVPPPFEPITPACWEGTEPQPQRWLAAGRIPCGDLTLYSGNGGAGKTETAVQLLVTVAADLGDWLGCVTESGPVLFLSCEEPESNIRDRVERICKYRSVDPHGLHDLHLHFPDLESTWLASADRAGRIVRTPLLDQVDAWIAAHKPRLVVIDSIAAVFDGEAIARRQVRSFLAMLRKLARDHETAIVLLDHPSVRGMADGSGTANSVDWRNSVRSMLHLSDPEKDDQDVRQLEVKKNNYGRAGEKVMIRWGGLTFVTEAGGPASSPHRAAAERHVDDTFLRLVERFLAEGRPVRHTTGSGYAPAAFEGHPEAGGIKSKAFAAAMERLFAANKIVVVDGKRSKHIERAPG